MDWDYCIAFYLNRHCPARDLTSKSIASYQGTLKSFREYVRMRAKDRVSTARWWPQNIWRHVTIPWLVCRGSRGLLGAWL